MHQKPIRVLNSVSQRHVMPAVVQYCFQCIHSPASVNIYGHSHSAMLGSRAITMQNDSKKIHFCRA